LPTQVINAVTDFFVKFANNEMDQMDDESEDDMRGAGIGADGTNMPVMWHQTLLALVQCYRPYLSVANCLKLKALIKVHWHDAISPEIRKCLAADYLQQQQQRAQ